MVASYIVRELEKWSGKVRRGCRHGMSAALPGGAGEAARRLCRYGRNYGQKAARRGMSVLSYRQRPISYRASLERLLVKCVWHQTGGVRC